MAVIGFPIMRVGVLHGKDDDGMPRAMVTRLFGDKDVYLTPAQLRKLGAVLQEAADDCERLAKIDRERDGFEYELF